ncbi:Hpt domain protein [compost metagenome]
MPGAPSLAPADTPDPLTHIEGLDTAAGLRRVLGKRTAYESLLRKFVAGQGSAVKEARAHLAAAQPEAAQRAMHTLKGTAATIGAVGLAELAGAAEQAIAHNATADVLEALLPPVDTACQTLVAALQSALPPEADTPGTASAARTPLDGAQARALVERLGALLEDSDSDAIELFKDSGTSLQALLGPAYADMKRLLDNYLFADALDVLRKAGNDMQHKEDPVHE